jgi:hypothetical protein
MKDAQYWRDYRARRPGLDARRRTNRDRTVKKKMTQQFCGVDGEGADFPPDGELFGRDHQYTLLRAGEYALGDGTAPLKSLQCLAFLADLPKDRAYVAYYFDYDATMILRGLREERIRRIIRHVAPDKPEDDSRQSAMAGVEVDGQFIVRYLPHKELAVKRVGHKQYTVISDVGPFFQSSFVEALRAWKICDDEMIERIQAGKLQRGNFGITAEQAAYVREYNQLEIELLEKLMGEFREVCADAGYLPRKWQGPGQIASVALEKHGIPKRKDIPACQNKLLMRLANEAYYGGRFETCMAGPVTIRVDEYDINSAYPAAMLQLPCLRHGTWIRGTGTPPCGSLWFGQVTFDHPEKTALCNLPIRTREGGLKWPRRGKGVYWSVEVDAAQRAGTLVADRGVHYRYSSHCDCTPFAWVAQLYDERKRIGKSGKGKVLKLVLNSLYGKLAQSIGSPPFANPIHAGLITAITRAKIVGAYAGRSHLVVQIATDAVFALDGFELEGLGAGLGMWSREEQAETMLIVQPGVYFTQSDTMRPRTRGVTATVFEAMHSDFEAAFARLLDGDPTPVKVPMTQFVSLKQAVAWNRIALAGQWISTQNPIGGMNGTRALSFDWSGKRALGLFEGGGCYRTWPQDGSFATGSVPYSRIIGGASSAVAQRELRNSQPDWGLWFQPA